MLMEPELPDLEVEPAGCLEDYGRLVHLKLMIGYSQMHVLLSCMHISTYGCTSIL